MPRLMYLLYRLTLRLYPAEFRHRYEAEMLHDFVERGRASRSAGGGWAAAAFSARATIDVVPSAIRLRNSNSKRAKAGALHAAPERSGPHPRRSSPTERGALVMGDVIRDLQYSLRMLIKSPLFTTAAVMTLALGIGLNAATFSVVNGTLLRPLDGVEDPDELVQMYRQWGGMDFGSNSIPHYQDVRDRTAEVFDNVAAYNFMPVSLSAEGRSERTIGMLVSANFFQTYGVQPALGRTFIPGVEDRGPGEHPVVVLGHAFWQARFGGDPGVIGQTMVLNGHTFEIVGVAPESFRGPVNFAVVPIYVPLMMQVQAMPGRNLIESRGSNSFNVVGRLKDGQTVERLGQVMDATLLQLQEELPDSYATQLGTTLVPQMEAGIHPSFKNAQLGMSAVMMVVVGLLLLIACVNVANLFLARARERRREMGIRLSLGAGGRRLIQQLLTESVIFSLLSGLVGLGIAKLAMGTLGNFRPPIDGPFDFSVTMDTRVLMFTLGVSVLAGLVFGLAPALQAANPDTVSAVKGESSQKGSRSKLSSALVVMQMSLSLLLLISSGLFLRSLQGATEIDPGFDEPGNLVLASLDPGLQGYERSDARELFDRLAEQIEALPEVRAVGLTTTLPLGLGSSDRGVQIAGYEFAEGERSSLHYAYVTEGYMEAMGIEVLEGRTFNRQDDEAGTNVLMINKRFADRFWPGESAVGKLVRTAGEDREVIGVVETGKYKSLGEAPTEYMWMPHRQLFSSAMTLVVRTPSNPEIVLRAVRETVMAADPDLPLYDVRSMEDHMGIALLPARLGGSVLGVFGVLGLILAAVGIYGVMAYSVAQRSRELGIRVALGASKQAVLKQVLGEGMKLAIIGTVLGLVAAAGAAQLVKGLLYNVSVMDPVAFAAVPLTLVGVALLAVYLPARRAASVEPMKALKTD